MEPTQRFTSRAADYAAARPSYPPEAIDALFEGLGDPRALTVVDLGAGTGISSRLLAARGARVIAVEPNAAMRQHANAVSNLTWKHGTAERTGLDASCAHLVTAFQAFHWFDYEAALAEMARIARPGGRAAIVYNERDESDPLTAAYGDIVRRFATGRIESLRQDGRDVFEAYAGWSSVRKLAFANVQRLDRAGLLARAHSTSYLPTQGDAAQRMDAAVDALFDERADDGVVTMVMRTMVTAAQLSPGARGGR